MPLHLTKHNAPGELSIVQKQYPHQRLSKAMNNHLHNINCVCTKHVYAQTLHNKCINDKLLHCSKRTEALLLFIHLYDIV